MSCNCRCAGAVSSRGPKGDTGAAGAAGAQGEFGGFSGSWLFSTSTAVSPAATFLRLNNASPASVTAIYVSDTNADSIDYDAFLDSFSNDSKFGYIRIFKETDNTKYCTYKVTAVTDNGTDHTLAVTYISSNSTFAANDPLVLTFSPSGGTNPCVLSSNTTDVATSGAGTDPLMSYVVPINTLKTDGDMLEIDCSYTGSGVTETKLLTYTINGAAFYPKVVAGFSFYKGVKYARAKFTITRKSTTAIFITITIMFSDNTYLELRGYHLNEGTGAGTAVADLSANTLTFACFGENNDAVSNTETITQNSMVVKYFNK